EAVRATREFFADPRAALDSVFGDGLHPDFAGASAAAREQDTEQTDAPYNEYRERGITEIAPLEGFAARVLIQEDTEELRGNHAGGKAAHSGQTGCGGNNLAVEGLTNLVKAVVRGWRANRNQNIHADDHREPAWVRGGEKQDPCRQVQ